MASFCSVSPACALTNKQTCQRNVSALAHQPQGSRTPDTTDQSRRRALLAILPLTLAGPSLAEAATQPFLKSTGASGFLADEEEFLLNLRKEAETLARAELDTERKELQNQSGLCVTPFGIDVVGITELIALVGALVGGLTARSRKLEAERLNEQLRKINMQLRQQARAGTIYAPGLSYAPATAKMNVQVGSTTAERSSAPVAEAATETATSSRAMLTSMDEVMSPEQESCRETMREGKRLLRSDQGAAALVRFEKASLMSRKIGDLMLERRALRGMAASSRMVGNLQAAIKHLATVLNLSRQMGEYTGDADAYGSIADIYADLGEFEKAAVYYDKYIQRMQEDDSQ